MNAPRSIREVLAAEALDQVGSLLERVETLTASMDAKRLALTDASAQLHGRLNAFEAGVTFFAQQASAKAVEHIARRSTESARQSVEFHTRAMNEAARLAFARQMDIALTRLTSSLQQLDARRARPWEVWLTHTATAACASAFTWLAILFLR